VEIAETTNQPSLRFLRSFSSAWSRVELNTEILLMPLPYLSRDRGRLSVPSPDICLLQVAGRG